MVAIGRKFPSLQDREYSIYIPRLTYWRNCFLYSIMESHNIEDHKKACFMERKDAINWRENNSDKVISFKPTALLHVNLPYTQGCHSNNH